MSVSIAMITRNEEMNMRDCLECAAWADEIVIVDSGSTDKTLEVARKYNAKTFHRTFTNFAEQKNDVLSRCSGDWIFLIDADERISPELAEEIRRISQQDRGQHVYKVKRTTYFFGKPLRFSGTWDDKPIRLYPRGKARYEQPVHEHIVSDLPVLELQEPLLHLTTRTMQQYRDKFDCYIPLEVETMIKKGRRASFTDLWIRPAAKFILLYFFKLGILDGWTGFQFAFLAAKYDAEKYRRLAKAQS